MFKDLDLLDKIAYIVLGGVSIYTIVYIIYILSTL